MRILLLRCSWFVLIGSFFANKDMCLGGGHPPDPTPPSDASADGDAQKDARLELGDLLARDLREI